MFIFQIESMNYTTYIANQKVPGSGTGDVRTLISFDVGGNWDTLRPPETDVNGDIVECVQVMHLFNALIYLHHVSV